MEKLSNKSKSALLDVIVELDELDAKQGWPKIAAYVFSRSGLLKTKKLLDVDKAKPTTGQARFDLEEKMEDLVVKIGPDVEDVQNLKRYQPVVDKVFVTPEKKATLQFKIVKPGWLCWLKLPYLVTGTVEKLGGAPICIGEVDIYDVDIGYCIWWLPDTILERIRYGIIDILRNPPPLELKELPMWHYEDDDWCGTRPKPPFPPKDIDILKKLEALPPEWAFAKERLKALPNARASIDATLEKMELGDRQALLNREAVEGVKISQVMYSNTAQFRDLLAKNFQAFRFWLCWYPWIYWIWWPYCWWYSLEKLGTAKLQPDGSFSMTVWLSICRQDIPDLWFVVRQDINGVERVIYARHPVPCNTYWNHPSGKPVHLIVTDPSAVVCDQQVPVPTPDVYVMPVGIGWTDKWYEITQAHIKPPALLDDKRGLYNGTDPYGTSLNIRMQFDDRLRSLPGKGVWYYRWSYRREGIVGWTQIDALIIHSYLKSVANKWYTDTEKIGPYTVGTENNLFYVPDPNKVWLYDRFFAVWQTAVWDAQKGMYIPQVQDGKYELRLEMFDGNGSKVTPVAAGFKYMLATGPVGPVDETLNVQPDGSIILHLHIDNRVTVANIQSVALNKVNAGECQFLAYQKDTDNVDITYKAYHPASLDAPPNEFLDYYVLNIQRGISGTVVEYTSSPTAASVPTTLSFQVQSLMVQDGAKPYEQCAFAIELHTWPRTRDGYTWIRAYEAHATSAFALIKKVTTP